MPGSFFATAGVSVRKVGLQRGIIIIAGEIIRPYDLLVPWGVVKGREANLPAPHSF